MLNLVLRLKKKSDLKKMRKGKLLASKTPLKSKDRNNLEKQKTPLTNIKTLRKSKGMLLRSNCIRRAEPPLRACPRAQPLSEGLGNSWKAS